MSMLATTVRNVTRTRVPRASLSVLARSKHTLPDLPYAYEALEPHISGQIMKLHHTKHHQTYVNGLNAAEESFAKATSPKEKILLQPALKFNGGGAQCHFWLYPSCLNVSVCAHIGHINHSLFWKNLAPQGQGGGELKAGPFKDAITADFGGLDGEYKCSAFQN